MYGSRVVLKVNSWSDSTLESQIITVCREVIRLTTG